MSYTLLFYPNESRLIGYIRTQPYSDIPDRTALSNQQEHELQIFSVQVSRSNLPEMLLEKLALLDLSSEYIEGVGQNLLSSSKSPSYLVKVTQEELSKLRLVIEDSPSASFKLPESVHFTTRLIR